MTQTINAFLTVKKRKLILSDFVPAVYEGKKIKEYSVPLTEEGAKNMGKMMRQCFGFFSYLHSSSIDDYKTFNIHEAIMRGWQAEDKIFYTNRLNEVAKELKISPKTVQSVLKKFGMS